MDVENIRNNMFYENIEMYNMYGDIVPFLNNETKPYKKPPESVYPMKFYPYMFFPSLEETPSVGAYLLLQEYTSKNIDFNFHEIINFIFQQIQNIKPVNGQKMQGAEHNRGAEMYISDDYELITKMFFLTEDVETYKNHIREIVNQYYAWTIASECNCKVPEITDIFTDEQTGKICFTMENLQFFGFIQMSQLDEDGRINKEIKDEYERVITCFLKNNLVHLDTRYENIFVKGNTKGDIIIGVIDFGKSEILEKKRHI
jgi:hypothetical protein